MVGAGLDVTAEFKGGASVPIGQPLANMRAYVLDPQLQLQPLGVPGELMVSGIQLARGYLNRPDLTAEKFIANPYSDGHPHHDRLYRTGMSAHPVSSHIKVTSQPTQVVWCLQVTRPAGCRAAVWSSSAGLTTRCGRV